MIKCENGEIRILGSTLDIEADLCTIIKAVRETVLVPEYGAEEAEERINELVADSKKTNKELDEDIDKIIEKFAEKIVRDIFGKGNSSSSTEEGKSNV